MLAFVSRVENHQIFTLLDNGLQQVEKILHIDNLDATAKESVERIGYVYNQINSALKNYDPVLIPPNILNNGTSPIQNANNNLTNYYGNRQMSYLNEANNQIDNYLPQVAPFLLSPKAAEEVEGFRESISTFRRSVAQHARNTDEQYKELQDENNKLRQTINDMTSQINSEKQRIDAIISQFQQQISTFQQQFSQGEDKRRETFTDEMEGWKDEYKEETENRFKSYNEIVEQLTTRVSDFKQTLTDENNELQQGFKTQVETILETIKNHKQQVEELVGVVTDTGLASGYHAVAKQEKSAKRFWRFITVAAMLILIGFAGFITYESYITTKELTLVMLGARIFGALSVGTLVAFAARQASLHGQAERANRKMELELKAIGPYLVGFEDKEIREIKRTLVEKFFGKEEVPPSKEETPKGSIDVIKLALETIQQVVKGKG